MKYIAGLLILLMSSNAFAVQYLNRGDPAPAAGFLFSPLEEQNLRLTDQKLTYEEDIVQLQTNNLTIYKNNADIDAERLTSYRTTNSQLSDALTASQNQAEWKKYGWFFGGVATTLLLAFAVKKVVN